MSCRVLCGFPRVRSDTRIMEEELESLWRKLSFIEEEDEKIVLGSNSTKAAKEVGRCCLVMEVLFTKEYCS